MHHLPVSPGPSVLPIPTETAPPNLPQALVLQRCSVHSTQSVTTGGALAANKSARCMGLKTPSMPFQESREFDEARLRQVTRHEAQNGGR